MLLNPATSNTCGEQHFGRVNSYIALRVWCRNDSCSAMSLNPASTSEKSLGCAPGSCRQYMPGSILVVHGT